MAGLLFHCTGIATLFHRIVTIGAPAESFKIRFGFITGARGLDSRDNHGDDAGTRVNVNSNANATHSCIVYLESTQLFDVGGLTLDKCVLVSRGCTKRMEKSSSIFDLSVNLTVAIFSIPICHRKWGWSCVVRNLVEQFIPFLEKLDLKRIGGIIW